MPRMTNHDNDIHRCIWSLRAIVSCFAAIPFLTLSNPNCCSGIGIVNKEEWGPKTVRWRHEDVNSEVRVETRVVRQAQRVRDETRYWEYYPIE